MKTLIVFGEDWGAHPSSTQHLIRQFSREYKIVWINSIGLRRPKITLSDCRRLLAKLCSRGKTSRTEQEGSEVTVVAPKVWPLATMPWLIALNRWLIRRAVQQHIPCNELPLVWASLPSAISYHGCFGETAWVYYCGDDFSTLAGVDHSRVEPFEQQMVRQADHIFVASQILLKKFSQPKTSLLEHGVDMRLFSTPQARAQTLPSGKPIAGFYGAIADWLDQQFLISLAQSRPDWNFVLVGHCLTACEALFALPNVFWLGPQPHHTLPSFSQHWQVSLLPFKSNGQIHACNPLKLREYLAAGTAIISTPFPALRPYRHLVHEVSTVDRASEALDKVVSDGLIGERRLAVRHQSWSTRAVDALRTLSALQNENRQAECKGFLNYTHSDI